MSLWKTAWSGISSLFSSSSKVGEKIVDIADEAVDTSQEKGERDATDTAAARAADTTLTGGGMFNSLVNGANRLVRPGFALWALGELVGWWKVPFEVSDQKMQVIILIITFYFGGRALLKDLPETVRAMRSK